MFYFEWCFIFNHIFENDLDLEWHKLGWAEARLYSEKPMESSYQYLLVNTQRGRTGCENKSHWVGSKRDHFWHLLDQFEYKTTLGNDFINEVKAPYWIDKNKCPHQLTQVKGQMSEQTTAYIEQYQYKQASFCAKCVLYILTHLLLRTVLWERGSYYLSFTAEEPKSQKC